jgi:broad specificity phosphatase PhoE
MAEIYIARYGLTESNKKKIYMGLSEEGLALEGQQQSEVPGRSLRSLGIDRIYSSPLRRAVETSEIINRTLYVPILLEKGLTEMRFGPKFNLDQK